MIGARPVVIAVAAELVATTLVLAWYWHRQRTTPTTYSEVSKITSRRLRIYRTKLRQLEPAEARYVFSGELNHMSPHAN